MKKRIVLFGAGEIAQLAHFYFMRDSAYEVAAFTVDAEYLKEETFCGLPVVPFAFAQKEYPPSQFDFFVALSYSKVNALRRQKYLEAKALGYTLASYVSTRATVLNDGRIGDNAFILEDNTIQPFVVIGNNVTLWSGNHIGHHSTIADHCFLASHIVVSGGVAIGEASFIGVNATLRDHISVGARCVIGAGTLLLSDAGSDGVYIGSETARAGVSSDKLGRL